MLARWRRRQSLRFAPPKPELPCPDPLRQARRSLPRRYFRKGIERLGEAVPDEPQMRLANANHSSYFCIDA
jgi:hypothetical protein